MDVDDALHEDVELLQEAWRNEKCGPELMNIDEPLVERVLDQVERQASPLSAGSWI